MSTHAINEAQSNLKELIKEAARSQQPVTITGGDSNAVLLSEEAWLGIQETLYLLSMPGMRESIQEGLTTPIEECDGEVEW